jgi:hypothetical protein
MSLVSIGCSLGMESRAEEQACTGISIIWPEHALGHVSSDSWLPQGRYQGPGARRNPATCSASVK